MTSPQPGRPTVVMRFVDHVLQDTVRIITGILAMAAGFWTVAYEMRHPPVPPAVRGSFDLVVLGAGLVFALLGFLMMPYVFDQFQKIMIFVFPGGADVPVVGHLFRRKDDKAPATPPSP